MPRKVPSAQPPVMTWAKAAPVLITAGIFDALRFFFNQFWFFAPALIGTAVGATASAYVGTWIGSAVGAVTGGAVGYLGSPVFIIMGSVMAMATALLGWLTVGMLLAFINLRVFKAAAGNVLWSVGGLGVSLIPLVGSVPALTVTIARMYYLQIKADKASLKAWKAEQEAYKRELARQMALLEMAQAQQDALERERAEEASEPTGALA